MPIATTFPAEAPAILVEVALSTTAAQRDALVALLRDTVAASLAEPGCTTYRATAVLDDPLRFHMIEIWADEAAYQAHRRAPSLRRFLADLPACGAIEDITRRAGVLAPYPADAR